MSQLSRELTLFFLTYLYAYKTGKMSNGSLEKCGITHRLSELVMKYSSCMNLTSTIAQFFLYVIWKMKMMKIQKNRNTWQKQLLAIFQTPLPILPSPSYQAVDSVHCLSKLSMCVCVCVRVADVMSLTGQRSLDSMDSRDDRASANTEAQKSISVFSSFFSSLSSFFHFLSHF